MLSKGDKNILQYLKIFLIKIVKKKSAKELSLSRKISAEQNSFPKCSREGTFKRALCTIFRHYNFLGKQ